MKYYCKVNNETKKIVELGDVSGNGDLPENTDAETVVPLVFSEHKILMACDGDIAYGHSLLKDIELVLLQKFQY